MDKTCKLIRGWEGPDVLCGKPVTSENSEVLFCNRCIRGLLENNETLNWLSREKVSVYRATGGAFNRRGWNTGELPLICPDDCCSIRGCTGDCSVQVKPAKK